MKELRKSQNMPQLLQILAATHQKPLKCKILHPYNYYYLQWVFPLFFTPFSTASKGCPARVQIARTMYTIFGPRTNQKREP
jgi:hypothetical protein